MTQNSEMIQGILKRLEIPVDLINPSKELTSIMVNIGWIEYDIVCSGEDGEDEIFIYTPDNTLLGRNGLISIDRIWTTFSSADVDLLKEIFSNLRNPANPPLETKYALAQEFIAIWDRTGASKLLEEVIGNKDTDWSLRVQAEATLAEITPKVQIIRD
jgi:FimV-like protein